MVELFAIGKLEYGNILELNRGSMSAKAQMHAPALGPIVLGFLLIDLI